MSEWLQWVEEAVEQLRSKQPRDRLDYVVLAGTAVQMVQRSCAGWWSWLNNLPWLSTLPEEELREWAETLRDLAIKWLEFDKKTTEKHSREKPRPPVV